MAATIVSSFGDIDLVDRGPHQEYRGLYSDTAAAIDAYATANPGRNLAANVPRREARVALIRAIQHNAAAVAVQMPTGMVVWPNGTTLTVEITTVYPAI